MLDYVEAKALRTDGMDIVVFRGGSEQLQQRSYDEHTEPTDTAEILAELITLRIAPGVLDGENGDGSGPPG
ncbi:MAG TPA: hypothetical protein VLT33_50115 [Labilithrix sp.]|nr:hypothetical protein [Labilithrix sp.]